MNISGIVIEAAGWFGAGSLILAYALVSTGQIHNGLTYQLLNLAGAIGLAAQAR